MIDIEQLRDLVVDPVLEDLGLYNVAASELVIGTGIQESRLTYIKQIGNGPALGIFQMEPATHRDIWINFLKYRDELRTKMNAIARYPAEIPAPEIMVYNLRYAAAMCRVHYRRVREPLPPAGDLEGQAAYWKKHYNTELGRGTVDEYIEHVTRARED